MPMPKILVVDDSQSVRICVSRLLAEAGYEVIVACDGSEAIERLDEGPSLVVLDVNMPKLDGYGFCSELRDLGQKYDELPIVFLTSIETKALELLGHEFGDYLHKPVCKEELLSAIEKQLAQTSS